ncbi:class I adenylate-forming enzyme family protein [Pilimelia anulata]|uniref:class I adenylate-forming enzyme family protein n=1 Tax=Pilimelia anulata TaxID=53371 RepID=UPI00166CAEC0|nr:AMP-binding protein [Pilimelia anulata]
MEDPRTPLTGSADLSDYVRDAAQRTPGRPAFRNGVTILTWAEMDARVSAFAAGFAALPTPAAGPGDCPPRLLIAPADGLAFAAAYFGCLRAGLVAVPVDPRAPAPRRAAIAADAGAFAELTDAGLRPLDPPAAPVPAGPECPAVLLYPPGDPVPGGAAMLPHRALLAHHEQLSRVEPPLVRGDDTVLLAAPLHQAYGLNCGLGAVAYHGACGVLADRADPARLRELVAAHHATTVLGVPALYAGWVDLPDLGPALETVRLAACGPRPPGPAVARRFSARTGHRIFAGYGLAEAAPVLTTTLAGAESDRRGVRIGHPLPGVQVRLRGRDGVAVPTRADDGAPPPDGEIVVRGPNLFTGYWPDGRGGPDPDGWWATGDRAHADADGALYLENRADENRADEGEGP